MAVDRRGGEERDATQLRDGGDRSRQPVQLRRVQAALLQVAPQPAVGWPQVVTGEAGGVQGIEQLQRPTGGHRSMLGELVGDLDDQIKDRVAFVGWDLVKAVEQQGVGALDELLVAGAGHARSKRDPVGEPGAQYRNRVGTGRARMDVPEADQHRPADLAFLPSKLADQAAFAVAGPTDQQQPPRRLQLAVGRRAREEPVGGVERLPLLGGGDLLRATSRTGSYQLSRSGGASGRCWWAVTADWPPRIHARCPTNQ
jgi:hypothetical protein